ncbi:hypothetical protein Q8A64_16255 [Oxalobacteraceae bacterium R-40]|uniref:Uncharacterized protein n=1 Tax=Keguizhuia sedimenti TaxID=3064264 RepID=A0ABU1BUJ9_9BURK|nr:hypothetical protein [Oxalobacteraceae bacterium R-40]
MKDSKVLPFKRPAPQTLRGETAASELKKLLGIFDQLIVLLRETYDEGIDVLTDELVVAVVRCREALAGGVDEDSAQAMLKEMREELRQLPRNLRSLLPGIGPRLGESLEQKLGIQFSAY